MAAVDDSGVHQYGNLANRVWPVWSPDGTRIAFAGPSTTQGMYQIGVMNADGTDVATLDHLPLSCNCAFSWSPDGTKVVVVRDGPVVDGAATLGSLLVVDVAGTTPVETIGLTTLVAGDVSWQRLAP